MRSFVFSMALLIGLALAPISNAGWFNGDDEQGQSQEQFQGQAQGQIVETEVGNGFGNFSPNAHSGAVAGSDASSDASSLNLNFIGGDTIEAPDLSKAPAHVGTVFTDMCSGGASFSAPGFGGSLGKANAFCQKLALVNALNEAGRTVEANAILNSAIADVKRQTYVSRFFDWIPLVGWLF
jgi:hypothetical protein